MDAGALHSYPLTLTNGRAAADARVAMVSLPLPLGAPGYSALGEFPTQTQPLAAWPESVAGAREVPRRQLMFVVSADTLPAELSVSGRDQSLPEYAGPELSCRVLRKKNTGIVLLEENEAELRFGDRTLGLRMGLVHGGETHWWEWLRVEELWSGPLCKAVRVAGCAEVERVDDSRFDGLAHPGEAIGTKIFHRQNWLFCEVFALMFANGVVQLTCRHVNGHYFDHGRDLEDTLPVIAFSSDDLPELDEALDGRRTRFRVGPADLDLADAASLVSPAHPGRLYTEGDVVVYQPYEGVEITGDTYHQERDDGFIVKAAERIVPTGVARTVRFTLSMGDAAPAVTRLVVPDWWYAQAGELWPDCVLPVHDARDRIIDTCQAGVLERFREREGCFDCSVLNRNLWEGELPYTEMLQFYLSGDLDVHELAVDECYYLADVGMDHATETLRMQEYPFGAVAAPLQRTVAMTFAWLETGDPYFLNCSEAIANRFYWTDRLNWPRRSYGRDAASVRSLIFLWDYTGKEDYLAMAREALGRTVACQRPDGSCGDQGGGVGVQGGSACEITKPWMALLAADPVIDYLSRRPGDEELHASLVRTGEFLLRSQFEHDGVWTWAYQYGYGDNPGDPWAMRNDPTGFAPHPVAPHSVPGYRARFLPFLTRLTGDLRYLEAWQRFAEVQWMARGEFRKDVGYTSNKMVQNIPFEQAHTWNARMEEGTLRVSPLLTDVMPVISAEIVTPLGRIKIACGRTDGGFSVETSCAVDFPVVVDLPGGEIRMSSNDCVGGGEDA